MQHCNIKKKWNIHTIKARTKLRFVHNLIGDSNLRYIHNTLILLRGKGHHWQKRTSTLKLQFQPSTDLRKQFTLTINGEQRREQKITNHVESRQILRGCTDWHLWIINNKSDLQFLSHINDGTILKQGYGWVKIELLLTTCLVGQDWLLCSEAHQQDPFFESKTKQSFRSNNRAQKS